MRTQRRLCSLCRVSDVRLCRVPGQEDCQKLDRSASSSAGTGIVKNLAGQRDRVLGQDCQKLDRYATSAGTEMSKTRDRYEIGDVQEAVGGVLLGRGMADGGWPCAEMGLWKQCFLREKSGSVGYF